jgi:hypothetical protein
VTTLSLKKTRSYGADTKAASPMLTMASGNQPIASAPVRSTRAFTTSGGTIDTPRISTMSKRLPSIQRRSWRSARYEGDRFATRSAMR